jgi:hypothetical protein
MIAFSVWFLAYRAGASPEMTRPARVGRRYVEIVPLRTRMQYSRAFFCLNPMLYALLGRDDGMEFSPKRQIPASWADKASNCIANAGADE